MGNWSDPLILPFGRCPKIPTFRSKSLLYLFVGIVKNTHNGIERTLMTWLKWISSRGCTSAVSAHFVLHASGAAASDKETVKSCKAWIPSGIAIPLLRNKRGTESTIYAGSGKS
jgi:hypothetical protein